MKIKNILLLIAFVFLNCKDNKLLKFEPNNPDFQYNGRHEFLENDVALISPGASVSVNFLGNYCKVYLKGEKQPYNYVSFELDGEYLGRIKIESDSIKEYVINITSKENEHNLKIIKESEASNGAIIFSSIYVENIIKMLPKGKYYIEFIGDSVTCGAAADGSVTPCNTGNYFDQENVYYSYGATLARALNTNFTLSAVSGIGIYRNWNDENIEEPIMSQVYENLYLNTNTSIKNNFKRIPDVVSICLGTNDMSHGDGLKPRLPFNKEKYVANYIDFIKVVYSHYPKTQIVLLNSPMIIGEDNELLVSCLKEIKNYFVGYYNKNALLFEFDKQYINGCSYHPSVADHKLMAQSLVPFFENILKNIK